MSMFKSDVTVHTPDDKKIRAIILHYESICVDTKMKVYIDTKLVEDFDIICKRIELFKLVDNIDMRSEVCIRKNKFKPEVKPDYEHVIVYNKPEDLLFIAAACELDPDLIWKTKYTQAVERALNYAKKYANPKIKMNDVDEIYIDYAHAGTYYKMLSLISGDEKYLKKYKSMILKLMSEELELQIS